MLVQTCYFNFKRHNDRTEVKRREIIKKIPAETTGKILYSEVFYRG